METEFKRGNKSKKGLSVGQLSGDKKKRYFLISNTFHGIFDSNC